MPGLEGMLGAMAASERVDRPSASPMDTSQDALAIQIRLWRRMSPLEKLRIVSEMSRSAQELSLAGIRHRHPDASDRECLLRLAIIKLGRPLALRVYPEAASLTDL